MRETDIDIWYEVLSIVGKRRNFETLGRPTKFKVIKVLPGGLMLEIGNGTRIEESKKDFENVWNHIREYGYISLMDIRELSKFKFDRPAYIPAILAELDFIKVFKKDRRTCIKYID